MGYLKIKTVQRLRLAGNFTQSNLGDPQNAEWGYISFKELIEINIHGVEIDTDINWQPKHFSEIFK